MKPTIEIVIRPYDPGTDDAYIYSTWTKYAWYSPKEPIDIRKAQFFKEKAASIKDALSQSVVKIACIKDDPYTIMGYIVVRDGQIEWSCIKKDYHGHGIDHLLKKSVKGLLNEEE